MVTLNTNEAEILTRANNPQSPRMPAEVARLFCKIDFAAEDHDVMHELTAKAKAGTVTDDERSTLARYEFINDVLALLRVKAMVSLAEKSDSNGD